MRVLALLALLAGVSLLTACGDASSEAPAISALGSELSSRGGSFALTVTPSARPAVGANQLDIAFAKPSFAKVLRASAFMPAHGHSVKPPVVEVVDGTRSRVSNLVFFMPGRWEVTLELEGEGGLQDSVRFNVVVE